MEPATHKAKYHVVCRDCSVERLFDADADSDATALEREHAAETDHRVVVGRIR